jgi:maltose-binding protein MalE
MKTRKKSPSQLLKLLEELKERRILQNLFYYFIGAIGLIASIDQIFDSSKIRMLVLILCTTGAPVVIISSYFHGKAGKNPIPILEIIIISICILAGTGFAIKIINEPTPMTILIRMMAPQESWFIKNIIKEFEEENNCKVIIKRFEEDYELCETLKTENENKKSSNVSLVKTPLHLTLLLYKEGLVKPYEDILRDLKFSKSEIDSWLKNIEEEYNPVALKMSRFSSITGKKLYFLPRKLETRIMIYRKSKVAKAVKEWYKFQSKIEKILENENGFGLPKNYRLEPNVNEWNFYDLFVVGYYWANTEYDGDKTARIAHRSKNYSGTVIGLIDRALQLGVIKEDIFDMYRFSDAIIDMIHWEAIFRKYNLYCQGMWQEDGWSGSDIYNGIKEEKIYLTWMHQLDCVLICDSEKLGIIGDIPVKNDIGVSIMSQGVSFELVNNGFPKRVGSRKAHTFGWFWGIPKNSPEQELALKLVTHITGYECHLKECRNFYLIPIRQDVSETLRADLKAGWQSEVYNKSLEQLILNGDHLVPRFKTLAEYEKFLDQYSDAFEHIVLKQRYSPTRSDYKIDRKFIRENLR